MQDVATGEEGGGLEASGVDVGLIRSEDKGSLLQRARFLAGVRRSGGEVKKWQSSHHSTLARPGAAHHSDSATQQFFCNN